MYFSSRGGASFEEYTWTRLVFDLLLLTIPLDVLLLALRSIELKQSCEHMMFGYPVLSAELAPADSPTAVLRLRANARADALPAGAGATTSSSSSSSNKPNNTPQQQQQRANGNGLRGILKRPYSAGPDTRPLRSALRRSHSQSFADGNRSRNRVGAIFAFIEFV